MRALGKLPVSSAAVPGQGWLQQLPPGPELCWPFTPGTCWVPAETPEHCRGGMAAFQQLQSGSPQAVPGFGWVCAGLQPPPGHWGQASPWHRAAVLFPRALHSVLGLRGGHIQDLPADPKPPARVQWPPLLHRLLALASLPWAPCPSHAQPGLG